MQYNETHFSLDIFYCFSKKDLSYPAVAQYSSPLLHRDIVLRDAQEI